jgi:hypothetical protein
MASTVVARTNTSTIDWGVAILAGMLAMIVFAAIELAFAWTIRGTSAWTPLDILGEITLDVVAPATTVVPGTAVAPGLRAATVGGAVLLALGALSGALVASIVHRMETLAAALAGALFGLAMYYVVLYGFARVFPALGELRDWMSVLAYVIQGVLIAGLYKTLVPADERVREERFARRDEGYDMRRLRHARLV